MSDFEKFRILQERKVLRAKRLLSILEKIGPLSFDDKDEIILKKCISILAEHLPVLVSKLYEQRSLCGINHNCLALIDEEINLLTLKNKELNMSVVQHVKLAAADSEFDLDVAPLRSVLNVIIGREKSLINMFNDLEKSKAA